MGIGKSHHHNHHNHGKKTPEWNKKYLETLTEDIVSFRPSGEFGLSDVRILMMGPMGTGKSSFYNTINSVFKGRIADSAPCGIASNGITLAFTQYEVTVRSGSSMNVWLCDTPVLEVTRGLDQLECSYLLDGNIPDYNETNRSRTTGTNRWIISMNLNHRSNNEPLSCDHTFGWVVIIRPNSSRISSSLVSCTGPSLCLPLDHLKMYVSLYILAQLHITPSNYFFRKRLELSCPRRKKKGRY